MLTDSKLLSSAAFDAQSLNDLKAKVSKDPNGNLKSVARQMEGMFVQMMLKSMREALPKDGLFSSDQTRLYTSMYDQQIAQQMTAGKGLGLADMMVKQMGGEAASSEQPAAAADNVAQVPMKFDIDTMNSYRNQAITQIVRQAMPKAPTNEEPLSGDSKDFLAQLSLPAKLASQQSGVPHHLILAQAALESGWGQRQIRKENGEPSFNIFGVKAKFRVYGSYLEALSDYVGMLTRNPRYAAVTTAASAEEGAQALQNAGYATDPNYARKLTSMIQQMKSLGEKVSKAYSQDISSLF
ncbi:flagellar assembly peptidoglycan hydrolase FlgJ [Cronobacter sakazakii]|nr:flagellar assembly peptidoglycan hydrolase FlgJ [Cronobacter sakazakii]